MTGRTPQVGVRLAVLDGKVVERELRKFGREGEVAFKRMQKASIPASRNLKVLDGAVSDLKGQVGGLSTRLGPLGAGLSAIGPAGAAAAAGIGALTLGLAVAAERGREAAASIVEVANSARRAGLDAKSFQELAFVADVNKISIDALTDGIKELNLRADEFIFTGKGPAAEAFQRLGFGAEELSQRLHDPSELLVEIIRRMEDLDRAAQIRISDELFGGTAGERFVELIDRGVDSVGVLIEEFRELGIGFEQNVIDKAEEADREYQKLTAQIENNMSKAFLNFTPIALATSDALLKVSQGFAAVVESFLAVEDVSTNTLKQRGADLTEQIARQRELQAQITDKRALASIDRELKRLYREAERIQNEIDKRSGFRDDYVFEPTERVSRAETSTEADRTAAEAWRKRIQTADERRIQSLKEINRLEKLGELSAEGAARARLKAEETYAATIKKTGRTDRQADAKLLREVQSLLKASATPAEELEKRLERIAELQAGGVFDRASGGNGAAAANAARVQAMREYLGAAEDTEAALERLQELAKNGLGADALAAKVALAERAGRSFGDTMTDVGDRISDGITDTLFAANDQAQDFGQTMKGLARQLARDFVNSQLRNLFGQFGGGFGGGGNLFAGLLSSLFGRGSSNAVMTATAGIYHDGGMIGQGGRTRQVPVSLFADAERRHQGGFIGPGERAIIAEDDERMLTVAMQKNTADTLRGLAALASRPTAAAAPATRAPTVNIYPQPGQSVETQERRGPDGGLELDVLLGPIERGLATRVSEGGPLERAIGKRYSLNRANGLAG